MAVLEINGKRVEVDDSFKSLSPEEQAATVDEIASSMGISGRDHNRPIGQVNAGIANTLGGAIDFINPLDNMGVTGSAKDGLRQGMLAIGADVATEAPQTIMQGLGRGTGDAAGALPAMGAGLQALKGAGGIVGQLADDLYVALSSKAGTAAELAAGGVSGAAQQGAKEAGAPEYVQQAAGVIAPMSLPLAGAAARASQSLPGKLQRSGFAAWLAARIGRHSLRRELILIAI